MTKAMLALALAWQENEGEANASRTPAPEHILLYSTHLRTKTLQNYKKYGKRPNFYRKK